MAAPSLNDITDVVQITATLSTSMFAVFALRKRRQERHEDRQEDSSGQLESPTSISKLIVPETSRRLVEKRLSQTARQKGAGLEHTRIEDQSSAANNKKGRSRE